jgi:rhamnogalacturonyl hydrolase YesR
MKRQGNQQKKMIKVSFMAVLLLLVLGLSQTALSQVTKLGDWQTGTSHTKESGNNRALIFVAHGEMDGAMNLASVTYGGQAMTKVVEEDFRATINAHVVAFILDEAGIASAASETFVPTWDTNPAEIKYASVFLSDVNQTDLTGNFATAGGTSSTISTSSLTTDNRDMVIVAATAGNTGTYTLNNGFTQGTHQSSASSTGVTGYKSANGSNETPSVTHSNVNRQVLIGFVVQAAPLDPNKASFPDPANGESDVPVSTNLSWDAPTGFTPAGYDVYFGTDSNAHNNPKHIVDTNNYDPPGDLAEGTTYYWAVDPNDNGTIYTGDGWSFKAYEPLTTGDLLADYILSQGLTTHYSSACSYYGVLIYSEATGDTELKEGVIAAYPPGYYSGTQMPPEGHVDRNVYGIVPFELYRQTQDANYLTAALYLADEEFANPRPDGLSEYTRFWIDDTYMIGSLQTQAYRSTVNPVYINRAVTQLLGYMGDVENLQQSNGLFYHTLNAPFHWGRGNGWAAAAMTEVLLSIPQDHPQRTQLLTKYQNMMAALVMYQGQSGMWYQVLDMPDDPRNWYESSCTGMFVFALATGVDQGWLPEVPYEQAALDGWAALDDYVDEQGRVHEICIGTGEGSDVQFYFDRPREIGNMHGQAAVIWAATAIDRLRFKGDINTDGEVNYIDLQILTNNWLGNNSSADIVPYGGNGMINFLDFARLAEYWMK